jgi:hypothetical protein
MSTTTRTTEDEVTLPPIQSRPKGQRSLSVATSATSTTSATSHHRRAAVASKPETSPWNLIMVGFCLGVGGGVAVALGSTLVFFLGFVVIAIAIALSVIGVIAEGIRYGARWVTYDQASSSS